MTKDIVNPVWLELSIDHVGGEVRIAARGSRGESSHARSLGIDCEALLKFASAVMRAANTGRPLGTQVLEEAHRIQRSVFEGDIGGLFFRLSEAANSPLLVRFVVHDAELKSVPWEAICGSNESLGSWGTSTSVLPVRGVSSDEPWQHRGIHGALKVLAIAPTSDAGLPNLKQALDRIGKGSVEWLDPIVGEAARTRFLPQQFRERAAPHVVHFLGHGDLVNGKPSLRMGDDDGEEKWIAAEIFAQHLRDSFFPEMPRLVILESCKGALATENGKTNPSTFFSAAEIIAQAGVDAVVAHLWDTRALLARDCSVELYRALVTGKSAGNIALALNAARRMVMTECDASAEMHSPVLYLRGPSGKLFDFKAPVDAPFIVPFYQDKRFVGRDDELEQLHASLQSANTVGLVSGGTAAGLVGMGGIGKTQLAVEYAYQYAHHYPDGVYWVNAAEDWLLQCENLALRIGLQIGEVAESQRRKTLYRALAEHLRAHSRALLIFDNLDDPRRLRRSGLEIHPAQLPCRLIFTTRNRTQSREFATLDVQVLPMASAVDLLLSIAQRKEVLARPADDDELRAAHAICEKVGRLPLALALAGSYLGRETDVSLAGYLERLRDEGALHAVDAEGGDILDTATQHQDAAITPPLRLQWEALQGKPDATLVLQAAALLGEAQQASRATLSFLTGLPQKGKPGYSAPLNNALETLRGFCLVEELTQDEVRLHPLVREFAERQIVDRAAFGAECATRLCTAYENAGRLHDEVVARGVNAVLADLRVGQKLFGQGDARQRLYELDRALDAESHRLRRWKPDEQPGFLLQQIHNRCLDWGFDEWAARTRDELDRRGWVWMRERFASASESQAVFRTFVGHTFWVFAVAVLPNENQALSASGDKTLKLWDLDSGAELLTLSGHSNSVTAVEVFANGKMALSGSEDRTLKLWDLKSGKEQATLIGHKDAITSVTVFANGKMALSGSRDKTLKVWDLESCNELATLVGHTDWVNAVVVFANGKMALSGSRDKTLKLWSLDSFTEILTLVGHTDWVNTVRVCADEKSAISGSRDKTLKLWDLDSGDILATIEGHTDSVNAVVLLADDKYAISASHDRTLKLWDLDARSEFKTLSGHSWGVDALAAIANGTRALSGSWDDTLKLWDLTFNAKLSLREVRANIASMARSSDGTIALAGDTNGSVILLDLESNKVLETFQGHIDSVHAVALSPDGKRALSGGDDRTIKLWDLELSRCTATLEGHSDTVTALAILPDGKRGLSGSWDGTLNLWDLHSYKLLATLKTNAPCVTTIGVSRDGKRAAVGDFSATIELWDLESNRVLKTLKGHADSVITTLVLPDGKRAISGSRDRTLKLWDLDSGMVLATLRGHQHVVTHVSVSTDGTLALSTSDDRTVRLWDLDSGTALAVLEGHALFMCCDFGPDNRSIVACDSAGTTHFIELRGMESLSGRRKA